MCWDAPPLSNSHHQDYYMFNRDTLQALTTTATGRGASQYVKTHVRCAMFPLPKETKYNFGRLCHMPMLRAQSASGISWQVIPPYGCASKILQIPHKRLIFTGNRFQVFLGFQKNLRLEKPWKSMAIVFPIQQHGFMDSRIVDIRQWIHES